MIDKPKHSSYLPLRLVSAKEDEVSKGFDDEDFWEGEGTYRIYSKKDNYEDPLISDRHFYPEAPQDDDAEFAEFIVKACNSYYELVEVLEALIPLAEQMKGKEAGVVDKLIKAEQALAKARGE